MLKDFSGFSGVQPDPAVAYVRNGAEVVSGNPGAAWTRPYMTFVPDRDSSFLGVGARVLTPNQTTGLVHQNAQYFTEWQLERAQASGLPRAYSPAREIKVVVKPDRLNLLTNTSFELNATGWSGNTNCLVTRSTTVFSSGTASLRIESLAAGDMNAITGPSFRAEVTAQKVYTVQFKVRAGATSRGVRGILSWFTTAGAPLTTVTGTTVVSNTATWTTISVTGIAPVSAAFCGLLVEVLGTGAASEYHYVDEVLFEQTDTLLPYFDGSFGDDYLWETGGVAHNSRSYYYENRLDRGEAIIRALRNAVPHGIGVGAAQFAVYTG